MLLKLWAKKEAFMMTNDGATAIEYGLIAAGISVAIAAVVFTFGTDLKAVFTTLDGKIAATPSP